VSTYVQALGALFLCCLLMTVVLTPAVMRFARCIGAIDRGGYRKVFKGEMPLLGGLGIALPLAALGVAGAVVGLLVIRNWRWVWLHHREWFNFLMSLAQFREECFVLAIGGAAIATLGLVDDTWGMRARYKLLGQIVVAVFIYMSGYSLTVVTIPLLGVVNLGGTIGPLLTIFWIVGVINAFNLIDGIDGLASGIALVGASGLVVLGLIQDNVFVACAGAALSGTLLAFLMYNFPPARIFLGDTGSMFLGFFLAVMSLIGARKAETAAIIVAPVLVLGLPIFETLISILRRYVSGQPIFVGDSLHTHHRLLLKGYSQPRVVLTLCGAAFFLAAAALLSASIPEDSSWIGISYVLYVAILVCIFWLAGYLRPTSFRKTVERRQRNRSFRALAHYASICLCGNDKIKTALLLELCRRELGLTSIDVRLSETERLAAPSDAPKNSATPTVELHVKALDGEDILIAYQFENSPDDNMRQDVSSCLASIFDQMKIERPT